MRTFSVCPVIHSQCQTGMLQVNKILTDSWRGKFSCYLKSTPQGNQGKCRLYQKSHFDSSFHFYNLLTSFPQCCLLKNKTLKFISVQFLIATLLLEKQHKKQILTTQKRFEGENKKKNQIFIFFSFSSPIFNSSIFLINFNIMNIFIIYTQINMFKHIVTQTI